MWIKFCGTTNLADAQASVEAGANALGFIFATSKREIAPDQAREIVKELPLAVEKIGLFVNAPMDMVAETVAEVGLTGIQLHGEESADYIELLQTRISPHTQIVKAIPYLPDLAVRARFLGKIFAVRAILVDSAARGGTGIAFDWEHASETFRAASAHAKLILAGGLDPDSVGEAISTLRPWGVDVVSGVETAPGKKDHEKLKRFVAEARKAGSGEG